jgi:hypothetical protein
MQVATLAVVFAAALAMGACAAEQPPGAPTPTPTPTPTVGEATPTPQPATPTPDPGVGARLLVAAWEAGIELREGEGYSVYEVATFDAAGQKVQSFRVGGDVGRLQPGHFLLAGHEVLVLGMRELLAFSLDGTERRTVATWPDDLVPTLFSISPDGRLVAFGLDTGGTIWDKTRGGFRIVEVATGRVVASWEMADFAGIMEGWPAADAWHADGGGVAVRGWAYRGGHGGYVGARLDGMLIVNRPFVLAVDPRGRWATAQSAPLVSECDGDLVLATTVMELRNLATWELVRTFEIPNQALNVVRFSPDGRTALLEAYPIVGRDPWGTSCFRYGDRHWLELELTTGQVTTVDRPAELARRWNEPGLPTITCADSQWWFDIWDGTGPWVCAPVARVELNGRLLFESPYGNGMGFVPGPRAGQ